ASGSFDGTICLWDLAAGKELRRFRVPEGHQRTVMSLAFSPDGRALASAGSEQFARLWDVATGRTVCQFKGSRENVCQVAFSPDARPLASAGHDRTIRLWERVTEKDRACLEGHEGEVNALRFSADGRVLASGSQDMTALLWDMTGRGRADTVELTA